jgi:hypothetical protein
MALVTAEGAADRECNCEFGQIMVIVKVPQGHIYMEKDLDLPIIWRRRLLLLYGHRLGQDFLIQSLSIHINYIELSTDLRKNMAQLDNGVAVGHKIGGGALREEC